MRALLALAVIATSAHADVKTIAKWDLGKPLIPERPMQPTATNAKVVGVVRIAGPDAQGWSSTLLATQSSGFMFDGPAGGILYFPPSPATKKRVTMTIELGADKFDKLDVTMENDGAIAAGVTRGFALVELELNHGRGTGVQGRVATATRVLDGTPEYPMIAADVMATIDTAFDAVDKAKLPAAQALLAADARKRPGWTWQGAYSQRNATPYLDHANKRLVIVRTHRVGGSYHRQIVEQQKDPVVCPKCICSGGEGTRQPRVCAPCMPCKPEPARTVRKRINVYATFAVRYDIDATGKIVRETRYEPQLSVGPELEQPRRPSDEVFQP